MTNHQSFSNDLESAPRARHFVEKSLPGVPSDVSNLIAVMVSELATNVVQHAGTSFEIDVTHDPDSGFIRVEVTDGSSGDPVRRGPDRSETRGRGLQIVEALSDRWGVDWLPDRSRKTVWFEVQYQPVPSAAPLLA